MKKLLASAVLAAILFGVVTVIAGMVVPSRVEAGCNCPAIWDPVVCNNGQVYSNACVARCSGGRGCTSTGGGPIQ